MFYYVRGELVLAEPGTAVIDCGGVGYKLSVSDNTLGKISNADKKNVLLYTYMYIREDAVDLIGFATQEELSAFKVLISVSGVGPKAAMSILSAGPQNFTLAVMTGDEKLLTAAQGIGKKTAQRIILELKDKIGGSSMELDFSTGPAVAAPAQTGGSVAMARAALQELGYSPAEIQTALKGADPNATTEELVRHALRAMVMKG
jgi:Holliday junction DNA helicase RuvA